MATYLQAKSGIYKIINSINNRFYIGCASNIRSRVSGHLYNLKRNIHPNIYLQRSWNKYGENAFKFEVVEFCEINVLHAREHYWVTTLNCLNKKIGFNIKPTDPNGCSIHSEETKEKLRIKNKGKKPSSLAIQKLKERKISESHKEILRLLRLHIDYKVLHRKKRGKKIIDTTTGIIYNSMAEVSEIFNIPKYELSRRLLGKRKNKTSLIYLS